MIAAMRPDIDNIDEYVRNTTARAFSVVASALGVPALLPFLKAVCLSKKSWQVRNTTIHNLVNGRVQNQSLSSSPIVVNNGCINLASL